MFCPNCGEELSDDALFCGSCGTKIERAAGEQETEAVYSEASEPEEVSHEAPVQEPAAVQQPEASEQQAAEKTNTVSAADIANKAKAVGEEALNKANAVADSATEAVKKVVPGANKTILLIACAALLVIIVVIIIIIANAAGGSGSAYTKIPHYAYAVSNEGELAIFIDGKEVKVDADYNNSTVSYAYNANAVVYNGVLYKLDGSKLSEVNDDVRSAKLSANRNAFVYVSDDALYIYKDGKETLIYDDFTDGISTAAVVVSPNGSSVMFVDVDEDGDKVVTYIYKGSKAEKFGNNIYPLSISDDASVLYAYKYDVSEGGNISRGDALYLYKNGKDGDSVKVKGGCSGIQSVSNDAKRILFKDDSGSTYYFASNLESAIKVDSGSVSPIFPSYTLSKLDDFKSFIGLDGSSIKKFTLKGDSYEKYTIASSVSSYKLSDDGKKLIYMKQDSKGKYNLFSISTTNENAEAIKIAEDITSFSASSDLSKIYILNEDDELVFSNGNSEKTTKITDDVELFRVSSNGVCCYVVDDALYTTSGGSKGSKVDKMSDVESVAVSGGTVFYVFNDGTLYVSTNGRSFEKTSVEA